MAARAKSSLESASCWPTSRRKNEALQKETATLEQSEVKSPGSLHEQLRREIANNLQAAHGGPVRHRADPIRAHPAHRPDRRATAAHVDGVGVAGRHRASERALDNVSLSLRNSQIQAAAKNELVVMLSAARAPTDPKLPSPTFNALVAGLLGLIAGVYLAFGYDLAPSARGRDARRESARPLLPHESRG